MNQVNKTNESARAVKDSKVLFVDKTALRGPLTEHYKEIVDMANNDPYESGKLSIIAFHLQVDKR